jgi:hypothetical protein
VTEFKSMSGAEWDEHQSLLRQAQQAEREAKFHERVREARQAETVEALADRQERMYQGKKVGSVTREDLANWFSYHPPTPTQATKYEVLREEFHELAKTVVDLTPACADQTVAIRKLRDALMAANLCLACNEVKW